MTELTSWSWALLEEPPVLHLLKNFPIFYGTQRFITVFARTFQSSASWTRSVLPMPPHPIYEYLRCIFVFSIHIRLGLPSGLFPSCIPTNILYAFLLFSMRALCPVHLLCIEIIQDYTALYPTAVLTSNRRKNKKLKHRVRKEMFPSLFLE
jgi:hypothetical protein